MVEIAEPTGFYHRIDTRQETTLRAWFDEHLPQAFYTEESGSVIWPYITVNPTFGHENTPDWFTDSRITSQKYIFPADDGETGLAELGKLREKLEAELRYLRRVDTCRKTDSNGYPAHKKTPGEVILPCADCNEGNHPECHDSNCWCGKFHTPAGYLPTNYER